jgi:hypothetical protein
MRGARAPDAEPANAAANPSKEPNEKTADFRYIYQQYPEFVCAVTWWRAEQPICCVIAENILLHFAGPG